MVEGSGPSLSTETVISPGASSTRWRRSTSTGGTSPRTASAGPERTIQASSPARRASGSSASAARRAVSGFTGGPPGQEEAHPTQLGELALVSVEHEAAGVAERGLQDRPLPLAQHQG